MSRFRIRKFHGPLLSFLVLFILLSFADFTGAGTSPSSKVSFVLARPSVHARADEAAFNNGFLKRNLDVDVAERRGATDYHGRTLLFKSLILAPLALVVLILLTVLLIPIPVISSPLVGTGKMLPSSSYYSSSLSPMQVAREILTAEECVERVSCELSRISRSYDSTSWIPPALETLLHRMKWSERIIRGLQGISDSGGSCAQFLCSPAKTIRRSLTSSAVMTAR